MDGSPFLVPPLSPMGHLLMLLKSALVGASWVCAYYALRHLPITVVTPIRATAPAWVLLGALLLFGERLSVMQWLGLGVTLGSYWCFSLAGRHEGIIFGRNRWIWLIVLGTLLGAVSALYDKLLLQHYPPAAVQPWFSVYLVLVLLPVTLIAGRGRLLGELRWRWTIPLIGISLILSDWLYFHALHREDSLVALVEVLRRSSVVISFGLGAVIFRDINLKRKIVALVGILTGVVLIVLAG
jgi:transporter family protein